MGRRFSAQSIDPPPNHPPHSTPPRPGSVGSREIRTIQGDSAESGEDANALVEDQDARRRHRAPTDTPSCPERARQSPRTALERRPTESGRRVGSRRMRHRPREPHPRKYAGASDQLRPYNPRRASSRSRSHGETHGGRPRRRVATSRADSWVLQTTGVRTVDCNSSVVSPASSKIFYSTKFPTKSAAESRPGATGGGGRCRGGSDAEGVWRNYGILKNRPTRAISRGVLNGRANNRRSKRDKSHPKKRRSAAPSDQSVGNLMKNVGILRQRKLGIRPVDSDPRARRNAQTCPHVAPNISMRSFIYGEIAQRGGEMHARRKAPGTRRDRESPRHSDIRFISPFFINVRD